VQIDRDSKQYNSDSVRLDGDIKAFNAAAANGTFVSQSEFAAKRSDLTAQVAALNASRDAINKAVDEYNLLRTQLEAISTKTDSLNRSINSNLAPTPRIE
jgi:N-methylhydantoinase B/oxoprolinase/acetone carboxylase alpha subunit